MIARHGARLTLTHVCLPVSLSLMTLSHQHDQRPLVTVNATVVTHLSLTLKSDRYLVTTLSPFKHCRVTLKIMHELKFRLNETSNHFIQGEGGGRGRGRPPALLRSVPGYVAGALWFWLCSVCYEYHATGGLCDSHRLSQYAACAVWASGRRVTLLGLL